MFNWEVGKMALMQDNNYQYIGREKVYSCENKVSREDKVLFVDSLNDGKLSYVLMLVRKFESDKDKLSKDRYGEIKAKSLKTWLKKNDKRKLFKSYGNCGEYSLVGMMRNITMDNKSFFDLYEDIVDEVFHRQLKVCEAKEEIYLLNLFNSINTNK